MTPADLARRLADLAPLRLQAVALFVRFRCEAPSPAELTELQPEIEAAVAALDAHVAAAGKLTERCERLSPIPSRRVPTGF